MKYGRIKSTRNFIETKTRILSFSFFDGGRMCVLARNHNLRFYILLIQCVSIFSHLEVRLATTRLVTIRELLTNFRSIASEKVKLE